MSWYEWLFGDQNSEEGGGVDSSGPPKELQEAVGLAKVGCVSNAPAAGQLVRRRQFARVFVRVYDLGPAFLDRLPQKVKESYGGMLHTGVEVFGTEWSFPLSLDPSQAEIALCMPGRNPEHKFRETLSMGYTSCSQAVVLSILDEMKKKFNASTWDAATWGCHQFTEGFCKRLGVAQPPQWVVSPGPSLPEPRVERVFVRVYDLGNTFMTRGYNAMLKGFGAFHTGVEVYRREHSFGMVQNTWSTGVTEHIPGQHPNHSFRETLSMGFTRCTEAQVQKIIEEMRKEWKGCTYSVFNRNCHNFADALCVKLGVGRLPNWVNDLASSLAGESGGDAAK